MILQLCLLITVSILLSCNEIANKPKALAARPVHVKSERVQQEQGRVEKVKEAESVEKREPLEKSKSLAGIADSAFVRLADFDDGFAYEMRYATKNNFLKEKVYDCAQCYIRAKTATALIKANQDFKKAGVRIRFFDCYRPKSVQQKMWKIRPDPRYVANPIKGSIHNKGGAVDITLETLEGKKLEMGTDFDFFGKRSHHDNFDLPKQILENRKLLKDTMKKHGFGSIRSEWWHYHLEGARKDPIANFEWSCD